MGACSLHLRQIYPVIKFVVSPLKSIWYAASLQDPRSNFDSLGCGMVWLSEVMVTACFHRFLRLVRNTETTRLCNLCRT